MPLEIGGMDTLIYSGQKLSIAKLIRLLHSLSTDTNIVDTPLHFTKFRTATSAQARFLPMISRTEKYPNQVLVTEETTYMFQIIRMPSPFCSCPTADVFGQTRKPK